MDDYIAIVRQFYHHEERRLRDAFQAAANEAAGVERGALLGLFEQLGLVSATPEVLDECIELCGFAKAAALEFGDAYQVLMRYRQQHGFAQAELDEIAEAFRKFDYDGSRSMNAAELECVILWLGFPTTFTTVRNVLEECDIDESGEVEFEELVAFVAKYRDHDFMCVRGEFLKYATSEGLPSASARSAMLQLGLLLSLDQARALMAGFPDPMCLWDFVRVVARARRQVRDQTRMNLYFTPVEVVVFRRRFKAQCEDGIERIRNKNLSRLLEELYPNLRISHDANMRARKLLEASDGNGDGHIDFPEFLKMMRLFRYEIRLEELREEKEAAAKTNFTPQAISEFRKAFQLLDQDCSGTVAFDELAPVLSNVWSVTRSDIAALLRHVHADKKDGHLSFVRFLMLMQDLADAGCMDASGAIRPKRTSLA